jgi:putative peptide zinc metalloprotease protein
MRQMTLGIILATLVAVGCYPWRGWIDLPAVHQVETFARLFPPVEGRIVAQHGAVGDDVTAETVLFELESPQLDHDAALAQRSVTLYEALLQRQASGSDAEVQTPIWQRQLEVQRARLAGLEAQRQKMILRSPVAGRMLWLGDGLHPGRWISSHQALALVGTPLRSQIAAFVEESDWARVRPGALGRFYPADWDQAPLSVRVGVVSGVNVAELDIPYLADVNGGSIPVQETSGRVLHPLKGLYRVILIPDPPVSAPPYLTVGEVRVEGPPESLFIRIWKAVWAVIIRESGF